MFVWAAAAGAVFYHVAFVRNGRQFYAVQTREPTVRLPDSVKLPPGVYRWSVRPAVVGDSGIVIGEAVAVRTFRVPRG